MLTSDLLLELLEETGKQILCTLAAGYVLALLSQYCFRWYHRPRLGPTHLYHANYYRRQPRRGQQPHSKQQHPPKQKRFVWYPFRRPRRRSSLVVQVRRSNSHCQHNTIKTTTTTTTNNMRTLNRTPSQGSDTSSRQSPSSPGGTKEIRPVSSLDSPDCQQQRRQQQPTFLPPSRTTSTASCNGSITSIDPPVLVYHESARSIVFRDHLRRAVKKEQEGDRMIMGASAKRTVTTEYVTELMDADRDRTDYVPPDDMIMTDSASHSSNSHPKEDTDHTRSSSPSQQQQQQQQVEEKEAHPTEGGDSFLAPLPLVSSSSISNCFQPSITPLPKLALGPNDELEALVNTPTGENGNVDPHWTVAEREVVDMLARQQALVKTIKNVEWTPFLHRFQIPNERRQHCNLPTEHDDIPAHNNDGDDEHSHSSSIMYPFNSFVTSCSLLPPFGKKMRAYGSPTTYTAGIVFALPQHHVLDTSKSHMVISEDEAATINKTWSWPAGYSAKTEFNIDGRGNLINGRDEARVSLSELRALNVDYLTKEDHSTFVSLSRSVMV